MSNGCCTTENKPRALSQVEDQMQAMDSVVYRLSEMADRLTEKLSPIARQPEPCCTSGASATLNLVPLADSIRSQKDRIGDISGRLEDLLSRVEL